jgi:hypothetical protein
MGPTTVETAQSAAIPAGMTGTANATCPSGQRALSGGGSVSGGPGSLESNAPIATAAGALAANGQTPVGWQATAANPAGAPASITVTAYVVCLS